MKRTNQEIAEHVERISAAMPECDIHCQREQQPADILQVSSVGPRYIQLKIRVSDEFATSYTRPGQYITLSTDALQPRFFVIANAPDTSSHEWEFLLDIHSEAGQICQNLVAGSKISVTRPEGSGFPVDQVAGKHVLLFTTGSGIATMRGALDYWNTQKLLRPESISLYYGESVRSDFAYIEWIEKLRAQGVRVYLTEDQRAVGETGHRYVQDAFEDDRPELHDTVVFLSGAGVMMRAVSEKFIRLGLAPEHLYTNV